ncbi:MAG: PRC-barrel domain-containing protein [Croceibacterium sp.]
MTDIRAARLAWVDLCDRTQEPHRLRRTIIQEATMRTYSYAARKAPVGAMSIDAHYAPYSRQRASLRGRLLLSFVAAVAIVGPLLVVVNPKPVLSQGVQLVQVDVNVVAQGYRLSKLTGSSVTNEKNEKIGTVDDFVVARNRALFAVLHVGGFLGIGAHLVAVPYDNLIIDDEGSKIQLPGASKDELKKLPELKYRS